MRNPYQAYVKGQLRLLKKGLELPLGGFPPHRKPRPKPEAPKVLLFSPHPDDECIVGALPLRLLREGRMDILNVAVTLGSRKDRRAGRWEELSKACVYLGLGLLQAREGGLEGVNLKSREESPEDWSRARDAVREILRKHRPKAVFLPHSADWNSTHVGTHRLVLDALAEMDGGFSCHVIETEYWAPMASPNLMVESSASDAADLIAALSFHAGEVRRSAYHLSLPAWMVDNVRRGGELVGGQGAAAPGFGLATLYRLRRWSGGVLQEAEPKCRFLPASENAAAVLDG